MLVTWDAGGLKVPIDGSDLSEMNRIASTCFALASGIRPDGVTKWSCCGQGGREFDPVASKP